MNPQAKFAETIVNEVEKVLPFGKFERFTAGVCMAIPFFLLVTDLAPGQDTFWMIMAACSITLFPFAIGAIEKFTGEKAHKYFGMIITVLGGATLYLLYKLFTSIFDLESRKSISAYVMMDNSYYFGMLLAIAAMLFVASGVVFWERKKEFKEGSWRSVVNIGLGLLLIGVIIVPCNIYPISHLIIAGVFFAGCGIATALRESKPEARAFHLFFDYGPVVIMLLALAVAIAHDYGLISDKPITALNLFGAESIALWITGLDFILVSLKREMNPAISKTRAKETSQGKKVLQD